MRNGKLPLRTVLENFINHVDTLDNDEKGDRYDIEFQDLKKFTEDLKSHPDFCTQEGERECNRKKNRYKDILPYDKTRVTLQEIPGVSGSDYVNANYIHGASGSKAYIASQGPLAHTVNEFWRIVVECDVQVIIMASNETEGGKHKCECYWVSGPGEEKQFGNVNVSFVKSRQVCPDFLVRTFKIKYTNERNKTEERIVCQFHYILWPDHGIPDTVRPLLDMVRLVRDCQASETLPVLVHCSAGCGRTGTICAIDYVWGLLRTGKLTENLDLFGLTKRMRQQRVAMVQTREQYILLHEAVKELFKERLKLIDAHPYENVATDGNPLILREKEKESLYEELYVKKEKHDKSSKASSATSSDSSPSDSLSKNFTGISKDSIRRSASTSSLDSGKRSHVVTAPQKCSTPKSSPAMHLSEVNKIPERKKPYTNQSKREKEAENFALAQERRMFSQVRSISNLGISRDLEAARARTMMKGTIPKPPQRSRTPSPKLNNVSNVSSINKLKQVFEDSPKRGSKLSRSASSVSVRPSLSISNKHVTENIRLNKSLESEEKPRNVDTSLSICPPPPPSEYLFQKPQRSLTSLALINSSSTLKTSGSARNDTKEEKPSLPIKKSKSFRLNREENSNISYRTENKSNLLPEAKSYDNEKYKLSVYQNPGEKPLIPPKKNIGDKYSTVKAQNFSLPKSQQYVMSVAKKQETRAPLSEISQAKDPKANAINPYVNARLRKASDEFESFVPLPTKRSDKAKHQYVNIASLKRDINLQEPSMESTVFSDYEPVDFGESSSLSSDVFETINAELVSPNTHDNLPSEYQITELDSIAKQVYRDCENYLLSGDSRSPMPSLIPPSSKENSPVRDQEPSYSDQDSMPISDPDLAQVMNKIAVPPQGLRNRERRNSYRQAVNSSSYKVGKKSHRGIHKYEKIWFENEDDQIKSKTEANLDNSIDMMSNINQPMNINKKDALFKDKLEELNIMMNNLERKHLQYLPDLSEEELSSKHSSSTSSLVSRSGQSSRSSERTEPTYNIKQMGSQFYAPLDDSKIEYFDSKTESHFKGAISPYGTLATTTSHPYKPKPKFVEPGNSQHSAYTATLPHRIQSVQEISFSKNTLDAQFSKSPLNIPFSKNVPLQVPFPKNPPVYRKVSPQIMKNQKQQAGLSDISKSTKTSNPKNKSRSPPRTQTRTHGGAKKKDHGTKSDGHLTKPNESKQKISSNNPKVLSNESSAKRGHNPLQHSMSSPYLRLPPKPLNPQQNIPQQRPLLEPNVDPQPLVTPSALMSKKLSEPVITPSAIMSKKMSDRNRQEICDSSDTSSEDDEGTSGRFSASNFLKKLRVPGKQKEVQDRKEDEIRSPSGSPKSLGKKAFGKLKMGSKQFSANFKSYLNRDKEDEATGGSIPLQKSGSCSDASIQNFDQVVKDYRYPSYLPKKPIGPREYPSHYIHANSQKQKPKQQYL